MKIKPISEEEIRKTKIQGNLPNRPTQNSLYNTPMTSEEIKAILDALPLLLAERLNQVINQNNEEISLLPPVTENDNEKVLTVQNGEWVAKHISTKETLPYIFLGNSGNIGDEVTYEKIVNDKFHLFYYAEDDAFVLLTPSGMLNDGDVVLFQGVMLEGDTPTATLYQITLFQNQSWTVSKYPLSSGKGEAGTDGKSAYEIAVSHGFLGSEEEWLASLKAESAVLESVTTADNGKFLGVKNGKAVWLTLENPLPSITAADNGKVIGAEDGKWVLKTPKTPDRESITINGGNEGFFSEEEYAVLSDKENYIEYVTEESTNNLKIYGCYLSENTQTKKTYVSNTYSSVDGSAVYIMIHVYNDRSWYKIEKNYQCFAKPTASDNGKILEVVNGHPTWVENSTTESTREYVTLHGGNNGYLSQTELSVLSDRENGIEYVIEESTDNSKIYYCHLSEDTKTKKTYVSDTFISENGAASYIIIHLEPTGAWYKTQSTYKGFLSPTAADSGKVLTVHTNGAAVWADLPDASHPYLTISGKNSGTLTDEEYAILSKSGSYIQFSLSGILYPCMLAKETSTKKSYASPIFTDSNGAESYVHLEINSNKSWAHLIVTIPTKTSQLTNDSHFVTETALSNKGYAVKNSAETWTFTLADGSTVTKKVVLA